MADRSVAAVREIAPEFALALEDASPHGSGHINDTWAVTAKGARYLFQRINRKVFPDVPLVMENIRRVTAHLASRGVRGLELVETRDGRAFHQTPGGEFWRVYHFVEGARTVDRLESPAQAYEVGRAFGAFQRSLADLPGARLREAIPDFHHTRKRYDALQRAAAEDVAGRAGEVKAELERAARREKDVDRLLELAGAGELPERVTHNDTKVNNVLLDERTGEAVCVVDLDTVMPGLSLYDYGDMVRSLAGSGGEDERDLPAIHVRLPVFEEVTRGFAAGAGDVLTECEWEHMVLSAKLISLELGMRFLTDHLRGDVYFKTQRPGHNLERCRAQFRLVEAIEEQTGEMERIVREIRGRG